MQKLLFANVLEQSIIDNARQLRELREREIVNGGVHNDEFSKAWQLEELAKKSWGDRGI